MEHKINFPAGYESLVDPLRAAVIRTAEGKGKQRHATEGQPFAEQQICRFSHGFRTGQIMKKASESERLKKEAAMKEMEDIIIYACAEWIVLRDELERVRLNRAIRAAKADIGGIRS